MQQNKGNKKKISINPVLAPLHFCAWRIDDLCLLVLLVFKPQIPVLHENVARELINYWRRI
jgi:hypothetical protein